MNRRARAWAVWAGSIAIASAAAWWSGRARSEAPLLFGGDGAPRETTLARRPKTKPTPATRAELSELPLRDASSHMPERVRTSLIERVSAEKTRVCTGEEVRVQVGLHSGATAGELRVEGDPGSPAILRFFRPGLQHLDVYARRGDDATTEADAKVADIEVIACDEAQHAVRIVAVDGGVPGLVRARVVSRRGLVEPLQYDWEFGDGRTLRTADSTVFHEYDRGAGRPAHESFVIRLVARDAEGVEAVARAHVLAPR